jgi:hypothetical protein
MKQNQMQNNSWFWQGKKKRPSSVVTPTTTKVKPTGHPQRLRLQQEAEGQENAVPISCK